MAGVPIAAPTAAGMWMKGWLSRGPASISATRTSGSADRRLASTHPAVPAPTITKSKVSSERSFIYRALRAR